MKPRARDGRREFGSKFVILSARDFGLNRRAIVDVRHIKKGNGGEGRAFVASMKFLKEQFPELMLAIYDSALRCVHINSLYKLGIISVATKYKKDKKFTCEYYSKVKVHGGLKKQVDLYLYDAWPSLMVHNVKGEEIYIPLEKTRVKPKRGRTGAFEITVTWKIPDVHGGGTVNLRVDTTNEDKQRGFNRAENMRPFSIWGDPKEYTALAGRREDTESGNRSVKRNLIDSRGRSLGAQGKLLDLLAHAFSQNAMTRRELELSRPTSRAA